MAVLALNLKPDVRQLRWFGCLWLPLLALVIGGVVLANTGWVAAFGGGCLIAVASLVVGALAPRGLRPVFLLLTVVTFPLGFLVSHLLLLLLYFGIITPLALVLRATGRARFARRPRGADSYWEERGSQPPVARYFRQF